MIERISFLLTQNVMCFLLNIDYREILKLCSTLLTNASEFLKFFLKNTPILESDCFITLLY